MNPAEYRSARISLEMSQAQLAAALGVGRQCISDRESGRAVITREAELALRYLCE